MVDCDDEDRDIDNGNKNDKTKNIKKSIGLKTENNLDTLKKNKIQSAFRCEENEKVVRSVKLRSKSILENFCNEILNIFLFYERK